MSDVTMRDFIGLGYTDISPAMVWPMRRRTADGRPMVQEVAILFEDFLWRGNRASKRSADNFNAFRSSNYPELARIGLGIHYNRESLHRDHGHGSGEAV
mgnify:CR=1 FL=1